MRRLFKTQSILTLLLLSIVSTTAFAQPASVGAPTELITSSAVQYQRPLWSPDGTKLAFTAGQNLGIWVTDANGNNVEQITDDAAGFGFSWSLDSESLLARVSETQNRRQKMAIKIYHTNSGEITQLTDLRDNMPALPVWANFDENVVLISDNAIEKFESGITLPTQLKSTISQPFYVLKPGEIATGLVPDNALTDVSPFNDATYLNLQVSPDGQKLAFEVYGGNLYVMNVDGSNLKDLGQANRPSWSPDSKYVVAMIAEDDGYSYKKSDLYALNIDGTERINLTESTDLVAMNPSWSPTGTDIAFDSPDTGSIYLLKITQ